MEFPLEVTFNTVSVKSRTLCYGFNSCTWSGRISQIVLRSTILENYSLQRIFNPFSRAILKISFCKNDKWPLGCLRHSCTILNLRKSNRNWTVAQTNGYSFLQKWSSELFTSIVTMETNNISCIETFLSQYIYNYLFTIINSSSIWHLRSV